LRSVQVFKETRTQGTHLSLLRWRLTVNRLVVRSAGVEVQDAAIELRVGDPARYPQR
jgi:hypothetical protein